MKQCSTCLWWSPNQHKTGPLEVPICFRWEHPTHEDQTCPEHAGEKATIVNVPQHTKHGIDMDRNAKPVDGPVEVLIVTYSKDFPWLEWCLTLFRKYCFGFQGVTIAHPRSETALFDPLIPRFGVRLFAYDEVPGKGMLQHMVKMAEADLIVPPGTKYVMHLDADCNYHTRTTPEDYFFQDKPVYLIRTWESLKTEDPKNPGSKVISDCHQWMPPTEFQLGFVSAWYTMCRHPTILPIEFYARYRAHIQAVHHMPFEAFMLQGRNSFPQDRMDWTAMGAWAKAFMPEAFTWIDIGIIPPPRDRQKAYWSHGGITPEIAIELDQFNRAYVPTEEEMERMAI
jgi:hypothetical protein